MFIRESRINEHPGPLDPLQQQFNTLIEVTRLQAHVTSLVRELCDVKSYIPQSTSRVTLMESEVLTLEESVQDLKAKRVFLKATIKELTTSKGYSVF